MPIPRTTTGTRTRTATTTAAKAKAAKVVGTSSAAPQFAPSATATLPREINRGTSGKQSVVITPSSGSVLPPTPSAVFPTKTESKTVEQIVQEIVGSGPTATSEEPAGKPLQTAPGQITGVKPEPVLPPTNQLPPPVNFPWETPLPAEAPNLVEEATSFDRGSTWYSSPVTWIVAGVIAGAGWYWYSRSR